MSHTYEIYDMSVFILFGGILFFGGVILLHKVLNLASIILAGLKFPWRVYSSRALKSLAVSK